MRVKILKWAGHVVKKVREQNYKINSERKSRRKRAQLASEGIDGKI
jgi:hypothetical protein